MGFIWNAVSETVEYMEKWRQYLEHPLNQVGERHSPNRFHAIVFITY